MRFFMHGLGDQSKEQTLAGLETMGFSGVVTGFDPEVLDLASRYHLEAFVFTHAYTANTAVVDETCLAEDVYGSKQLWFNSACPNHPAVQQQHLDNIRTWAGAKGAAGIYVDGARFASPCSSADMRAFFTCFCSHCQSAALKWGYNFSRMRRDVTVLLESITGKRATPSLQNLSWGGGDLVSVLLRLPGVFDWLAFRSQSIEAHMQDARRVLRQVNPTAALAMYIFSPSLAPWVGQDYQALQPHVDIFAPMIYRSLQAGEGPACLHKEVGRIGQWLVENGVLSEPAAVEFLRTLTGLPIDPAMTLDHLDKGLPPTAVAVETSKAKNLLGPKNLLIPIIQLADEALDESVKAVAASEADGVNFFLYEDGCVDVLTTALRGMPKGL